MKFTAKLVNKAWKIRRESAAKYAVKVSAIKWKICLDMAAESLEVPELLDLVFDENEAAAGKFANGPKFEQGVGIISEDGETIKINDVVFPRNGRGKMVRIKEFTIKGHIAFEAPGWGNCPESVWGLEIPETVKCIRGHTYPFRGILKKKGFQWCKAEQAWIRN